MSNCHCGQRVAAEEDAAYRNIGPAPWALCVWCLPSRCDAYPLDCPYAPQITLPQRPRNAAQGEGGVVTPGEGDSGCMKYGSEVE